MVIAANAELQERGLIKLAAAMAAARRPHLATVILDSLDKLKAVTAGR